MRLFLLTRLKDPSHASLPCLFWAHQGPAHRGWCTWTPSHHKPRTKGETEERPGPRNPLFGVPPSDLIHIHTKPHLLKIPPPNSTSLVPSLLHMDLGHPRPDCSSSWLRSLLEPLQGAANRWLQQKTLSQRSGFSLDEGDSRAVLPKD